MQFIESFVSSLEAEPGSASLCNPYHLPHRSDNLRAWLAQLLRQPGRRILLVGEALGYRGGLHTGLPFSSARLVNSSSHPFWRRLRPQLRVENDISEATASIVWDYLATRRRIPLFWNALPFHPHKPGDPASNRAPDRAELLAGQTFLQVLAEHYQPDIVAGLGSKGSEAARRALPKRQVQALRHASYGGKRDFCSGMDRLLR